MPTFCMLVSSTSLMSFMGPIAYDAGPLSVLVIGVLVVLVMILQFIVYGTHQVATFALRTLKSGAVSIANVARGFWGLMGGY